jgi:hypothetical protein
VRAGGAAPGNAHQASTQTPAPRATAAASARASNLSVFARLRDPGVIRLTAITRSRYSSRIRATSQQLPVTSRATRSDGNRLSASAASALRCTRHPTSGPNDPVFADRDHTEVTVYIQADRTTDPPEQRHASPPHRRHEGGEPAGGTRQTNTSSQLNPGTSQGRPIELRELEAHRQSRPTRLRSPKKARVPD